MRRSSLAVATLAAMILAACGRPEPAPQAAPPAKQESPAPAPAAAPAAPRVAAPAGSYALDPNHSSLQFTVVHLGLSNYVIRFLKYDGQLQFDPAGAAGSSIVLTVDPASVHADYTGDYKAGHKDSPYNSWNEALAQSPDFLNAGQHKEIRFQSTRVEEAGPGRYRITGDLTLVGQTHPVTLDATVTGSYDKHPFFGTGSIGFSAHGTFKRSDFGIKTMLEPLLVSDEVTIQFEGEFHQKPAAAPAPAG